MPGGVRVIDDLLDKPPPLPAGHLFRRDSCHNHLVLCRYRSKSTRSASGLSFTPNLLVSVANVRSRKKSSEGCKKTDPNFVFTHRRREIQPGGDPARPNSEELRLDS